MNNSVPSHVKNIVILQSFKQFLPLKTVIINIDTQGIFMGLFDKITAASNSGSGISFSRRIEATQSSNTPPIYAFNYTKRDEESKPTLTEKQKFTNMYGDIAKQTGLSKGYIEKIVETEGLSFEKYEDPGKFKNGKKTYAIGVGHNISFDDDYNKRGYGSELNAGQVKTLLVEDLNKAKGRLIDALDATEITDKPTGQKLIKMQNGKTLTQGQTDALVDLTFNVGSLKGTDLLTFVKNGEFDKAAWQFNYIATDLKKGTISAGLCKRRIYELSRYSEGQHKKEVIDQIALAMSHFRNKGDEILQKPIDKINTELKALTKINKKSNRQLNKQDELKSKRLDKLKLKEDFDTEVNGRIDKVKSQITKSTSESKQKNTSKSKKTTPSKNITKPKSGTKINHNKKTAFSGFGSLTLANLG